MMVRPFTLFCAIFASVAGMVLYAQKHKTTVLDHEITKIVSDTNKIKNNTAMLRTQWTLLNQPDRLKDLSTKFLPKLHPLAPTQFIKMTAVADALPAPKIELPKEQNNPPKNTDQNTNDMPQTYASNDVFSDANDVPIMITEQKQVIMPKHAGKPPIKKQSTDSLKNTATAQIAPTTAAVTPAETSVKPEYVENVSYNIQGSTKKKSKFTQAKPKIITTNNSDATLLPPKKHTTAIKVARYEPQKNSYTTQSALDNGTDEALPAPVPFSSR